MIVNGGAGSIIIILILFALLMLAVYIYAERTLTFNGLLKLDSGSVEDLNKELRRNNMNVQKAITICKKSDHPSPFTFVNVLTPACYLRCGYDIYFFFPPIDIASSTAIENRDALRFNLGGIFSCPDLMAAHFALDSYSEKTLYSSRFGQPERLCTVQSFTVVGWWSV